MARLVRATCAAALLATLVGCGSGSPDDRSGPDGSSAGRSSPTAGTSPGATPTPFATASTVASADPSSDTSPRADASAEPTAPARPATSPLALPPGPAVPPAPAAPAVPGSLASVDWSRWAHRGSCPSPQVGTAVVGDLDGDRVDEVAVPLTCPGDAPSSVLVYAGDAAAPRMIGDALPPEERARVQAVQVRDGHLVVGAYAWRDVDRSQDPDTAVTTRWVKQGDRLVRTDRWEDPAHLLDVDEEG